MIHAVCLNPCGHTEAMLLIAKSKTKNFLGSLSPGASVLVIDLQDFLLFLRLNLVYPWKKRPVDFDSHD